MTFYFLFQSAAKISGVDLSKEAIEDAKVNASLNGMLTSLEKIRTPGPGCSKLTTSLVNVSLKFQM